MTYVPRDPDGKTKAWFPWVVGTFIVIVAIALLVTLIVHA